ncbi:MAG: hypothetical protein JNN17_26695 [Verrucomicrobiaceae bacterium]|nr:hypothetical protein [Verrucomicrobiaceae bacterium]
MDTVQEFALHSLNEELPARIDLFIASASFESRSLQIAKNLDKDRIESICIASNANHSSYNGENRDALIQLFEKAPPQMATLDLDSDDPIKTADAFLTISRDFVHSTAPVIVVDVTAFTRESLAILLAVLRLKLPPDTQVTFLYNPATSYGDPNKLWLSKGLRKVRSILGFPGEIIPSRPNHLIVLPGYELERASSLIASYEPNSLSIGMVPKEANFATDFFKQQTEFVRRLQQSYSCRRIEIFEFSARDPIRTRDSILVAAKAYPSSNKIVIPLNSKPSVIGACLACFKREDLQMGYAQPKRYNTLSYSRPSDRVCKMTIALWSKS